MLGMKSHCLGVLVQVYVAAFCVAAVSGDDSHLVVKELLHCKFTWIDKTNGVQTECAAAADGRYAVLYSEAASKGSSIYTPSSGSWWTPEEFVSVIPGSYQLMAAPPPTLSPDSWPTVTSECPWPHLPVWISLLRAQSDFASGIEPISGYLTYSSEMLGRSLAWDDAGDLRAIRCVTKSEGQPSAVAEVVYLFADYENRDGVRVPTKRKLRTSRSNGSETRRSEQEFVLATFSRSPQLVEDALSTRQIKATMDRREPNGDIYAPDGKKKYNDKELAARIAGDLTGNTARARWSYWIVGSLTAFTLLLVGFKYWRRA